MEFRLFETSILPIAEILAGGRLPKDQGILDLCRFWQARSACQQGSQRNSPMMSHRERHGVSLPRRSQSGTTSAVLNTPSLDTDGSHAVETLHDSAG